VNASEIQNKGHEQSSVGCILVNYRTPREMLGRCLDSIFESSPAVMPAVVIVDNDSGDGVAEEMAGSYAGVELVHMTSNAGFAAAVNRGLEFVDAPYVLMLNTDAVLAESALQLMVTALDDAEKDCAGIAPKMMLSAQRGIIDSVGTVMPPSGASFSRGIGQCDLGQYDRSEEVAGVCFGAALVRRELFDPARVGPLYEGYFLYFEDTDWCMRAFSQGYRFLTEPGAMVQHVHSGITREEPLEFEYRLIELNTIKIVTRTFASPLLAGRVVGARLFRLLARTLIRRRHVSANLLIISSYLQSLPALLAQRRRLKARRITPDTKIFQMAAVENAWFDTKHYRPDRCLDSLIDTYQRLQRQGNEPRYGKILESLRRMKATAPAGGKPVADKELLALVADEPACVRELLDSAVTQNIVNG
jgi:GT2 family glycosyltransferase